MRISRLRLHNFRGWPDLDLQRVGHVLLAGVPRAGRSDIIAALRRLLDPAMIRVQPSVGDIRQQRAPAPTASVHGAAPAATSTDPTDVDDESHTEGPVGEDAGGITGEATDDSVVYSDYAEVEATLVDLDGELEQLCGDAGCLEPLHTDGQVDDSGNADPGAALGVRVAYRVSYDRQADALDHVVFFPLRSKPQAAQYARVPVLVRQALPVVVLNATRPLQLRAEGVLRRLITERDADAAGAALRAMERAVAEATSSLSADATIAATVDAVLSAGGVARRLADAPLTAAAVQFRPDDGSLSALLRTVQPALDLDEAGLLTLANHGSTATAVLNAAESLLLTSSVSGAVVLGDDFAEGLDAATGEHLASALRARAGQVWLATRRPEAARAFAPGELVRLTRHGGKRAHHVLPEPADRKDVALRRLLHSQLLPALTAPTVAITEGPHDLTTYSRADRARGAGALPLSAFGVRLISADSGSGGGIGLIPRVAELARQMGFRVIALIDHDKTKAAATTLPPIEQACDFVVRLPVDMAVEQAILAGVDLAKLRAAAAVLPDYAATDPTVGVNDANVTKVLVRLLHDQGLHEQFLDALLDELTALPPVLDAALTAVANAADPGYAGPLLIDLVSPVNPTGTP